MNEKDQLRVLADRFGVPGIDLSEVVILIEDLDLIPREVCETHGILPVLVRGEHLFLAMANPADNRVIDEIEFVTGKKVYPYAALTRELDDHHRGGPRRPRAAPGLLHRPERLGRTAAGAGARAGGGDRAGRRTEAGEHGGCVARPGRGARARRCADRDAAHPARPSTRVASQTTPRWTRGCTSCRPSPPRPPRPIFAGRAGGRPGQRAKVILVVDDEEDIRTLLKRVLSARGHRVLEAESGPVALQMVKQHVPDLLILDAMLPGLHGFDVAKRMKASERYGAIPIIMISAVYRGWRIAEDLKNELRDLGLPREAVPSRRRASDAATRALTAPTPDARPAAPDLDVLSAEAAKALERRHRCLPRGRRSTEPSRSCSPGTHLDPLAYRLHFHLALLYGKKDQVFEGIGELEIAIELNPKHFPALKNLAVLYERAGFKNRAVEMWERAVHAAPDAMSRAQVKERLLALL